MLPQLTSGRGWCKWATTVAGGTPMPAGTSGLTSTSGIPATLPALTTLSWNCNTWRLETQFSDGPPGTAFFTVAKLEPEHVLALFSTTHILFMAPASMRNNPKVGLRGEFSWVFILDEKEEGITRLIVRTRASYEPKMFRMLTRPMLFPADFLMARMMLQTIKQRVEQSREQTTKVNSRKDLSYA